MISYTYIILQIQVRKVSGHFNPYMRAHKATPNFLTAPSVFKVKVHGF